MELTYREFSEFGVLEELMVKGVGSYRLNHKAQVQTSGSGRWLAERFAGAPDGENLKEIRGEWP